MARVPGVRYSDDQPVVNAMGHTRQDKIGTHGGGDGPWQGVPSTPKQKRQSAYALHTRVQESTIPNAGLGLFMLERARKKERVAVYSGTLLTKEEAAVSNSMYIIEVNKNQFLDGQDIAHAAGRYINYAPYSESNAVMGAGKSPSWDDVKKRWWVSIFARKGIPAGEEIKMPYGPAYKGLRENANKKVKKAFAMRSSAQDSGSGGGSQTNDKQWKRACARMMKHMTALSQRLQRATDGVQQAVTRATKMVANWYNDRSSNRPIAQEAATNTQQKGMRAKTDQEMEGEPIEKRTVVKEGSGAEEGPKGPRVTTTVEAAQESAAARQTKNTRVQWTKGPMHQRYESRRTHYPSGSGKQCRNANKRLRPRQTWTNTRVACERAKQRALRRIERKKRQANAWTTII